MASLSAFFSISTILFLLNLVLAVVLVLFERRNPISTLVWLMVIFFIPILGFLLYLFLGQDLRKRKLFNLKKEEEYELARMVEQQKTLLRDHRYMFHDPRIQRYAEMIHLNLLSSSATFSQDNQVEIFNEGESKFSALIESIKRAQKYIYLEYYIFRNDNLGREILDILVAKAKEGIDVKVLVDGMGCIRLPGNFFDPLIMAGGKISVFFPPFLPHINLRVNYRNHRKICIVDGEEGFVGGFNIGDEYLGRSKRFGFWRDTHLRIRGSAVDGLEFRFLLDWRFASQEEVIFPDYRLIKRLPQGKTAVQIVSSGPDSRWPSIRSGFQKIISMAKSHIYIETPYFVPDNTITNALKVAGLSGLDIRIILPSKPDHFLVHWASLSYMGELLETGVRFYWYNKGFVHSKMITSDGFISTVGTANVDVRSFKLNFEVNAFIYSEDVAKELEEAFINDLADSTEWTLELYNQRSFAVKTKESVARLLSPLL